MTEIIDGASDELRLSPAELAVREMLAITSGLRGSPINPATRQPGNPATIDQMLIGIADLIEHIAQVIVVLYEDRHRAEETYEGRFAHVMVMHASEGAVLARQFAMARTRDERHQLNLAKEKLRCAEEMQKAVQNRSFGLMNIGKRITSAFGMSQR